MVQVGFQSGIFTLSAFIELEIIKYKTSIESINEKKLGIAADEEYCNYCFIGDSRKSRKSFTARTFESPYDTNFSLLDKD